MTDKCVYPKCRNESILGWLGKSLCQKHWDWVCSITQEEALAKLRRNGSKSKRNNSKPGKISIYSYTKTVMERLTADGNKPKPEEVATAVKERFSEAVPEKVIVMANSCRAALERVLGRPVIFDKPSRKKKRAVSS